MLIPQTPPKNEQFVSYYKFMINMGMGSKKMNASSTINGVYPLHRDIFKMTSNQYFKEVIACVSDKMLEKLKCSSEAFIKELLIDQHNKENEGNYKEYSWLNIVDTRGRVNHITIIIEKMFGDRNDALLAPVISDYFVPTDEEVDMLRRFGDNYMIKVYKYTQNQCNNNWNTYIKENPTLYSNKMVEMGMYFYMKIHQEVVVNNLFRGVDHTTNQLK